MYPNGEWWRMLRGGCAAHGAYAPRHRPTFRADSVSLPVQITHPESEVVKLRD